LTQRIFYLLNHRIKKDTTHQRIFLKSRVKLHVPIETYNEFKYVDKGKDNNVKIVSLKFPLKLKQDKKQLGFKFSKSIEVHQMVREHFAILVQMNEWELNESTILERGNFVAYFSSIGCKDSMLIESVIDYVIRAVPKLSLNCYCRFLIEGLLSGVESFQKQICFSIYSNFKERLYLVDVYNYFEDPLWKPIISDILVMYEELKDKKTDIAETFDTKYPIRRKQIKHRQRNSFLLLKKSSFTFEEDIMRNKNTWISYKEFSELKFPERVPMLTFLLIRLLCGQELTNYYAEQEGIKGFHYTLSSKGKYLVDRIPVNLKESYIRREAQHLEAKIKRIKPTTKQNIVKIAIKLFQAIKLNSNAYSQKKEITREDFAENSVHSHNIIATTLWTSYKRIRQAII